MSALGKLQRQHERLLKEREAAAQAVTDAFLASILREQICKMGEEPEA